MTPLLDEAPRKPDGTPDLSQVHLTNILVDTAKPRMGTPMVDVRVYGRVGDDPNVVFQNLLMEEELIRGEEFPLTILLRAVWSQYDHQCKRAAG